MTVIGPINYQINFESDVWNAFNMIAKGWKVYRMERKNQPIQFVPLSKDGVWDEFDENIIRCLLDNGLVEQKEDDKLILNTVARFELTKEGTAVAAEIFSLSDEESRRKFKCRYNPVLK